MFPILPQDLETEKQVLSFLDTEKIFQKFILWLKKLTTGYVSKC